MRWFRSHIGLGSRLALFALAVQIALCFSHIDSCDLGTTAAKLVAAAQADGAAARASGKHPSGDISDRADNGCPICALIQLAATSAPSAAPALSPPERFTPVAPRAPDHFAQVASLRRSFQARAPPVA